MIYAFPKDSDLIRQGDIFFPLPLPVVSLQNLAVVTRAGMVHKQEWLDVSKSDHVVVQTVMKACWGIVASQDCDAVRAPWVSLFRIAPFETVTSLTPPAKDSGVDRWWMNTIIQKSRVNLKWFYLPPDNNLGFSSRMAVDFQIVFQAEGEYLRDNISILRKGRLDQEAYEHYRESVAQFFRRYPYNEWYPLTKTEFIAYKKERPDAEAYEWQKD